MNYQCVLDWFRPKLHKQRQREDHNRGGHIQVLFTAHAFAYNIGDILICGIRFVQWSSRNVWTSRPPVSTVLVKTLARQSSTKLRRTVSHELHAESSRSTSLKNSSLP